jgi:hydrogenase nickel incorporation protein HypA/HybF
MKDLMNKIFLLANKEHAIKVTKVSVKLGALSHMSASHFKEHFDIAAQGTIAEAATLDIEELLDIHDPNAQAILLKSVDVAAPPAGRDNSR